MHSATRLGPWTIHVDAERIEVTSNLPRPDPEWRFTDGAGHEHYYDVDYIHCGGYPTLDWIPPVVEDDDGYYVCRICGQGVRPGMVGPSPFPEYINGPSGVSLTYDDGREYRSYAILTAEDAAGLTNPGTLQATIDRIASTQEPVVRSMTLAAGLQSLAPLLTGTTYAPDAPPSSAEAIIARQSARRLRDELFVNPGPGWFIKGYDPDAPAERYIYAEAMDAAIEAAVKATLS